MLTLKQLDRMPTPRQRVGEVLVGINQISRATIRAARRQWGRAYLGDLNARPAHAQGLRQYRRGMVYNFGADFVLPGPDAEVLRLVRMYRRAPLNMARMACLLHQVIARVEQVGGVMLAWS